VIVLGCDPGPDTHGLVRFDTDAQRVISTNAAATTGEVLAAIRDQHIDHVAIERFRAGGHCTADIVATIFNSGRFYQCVGETDPPLPRSLITRATVLSVLDCNGLDGNRDARVRQGLYQRFGGESGSRKVAVGTKANPGPLHGVVQDAMQALGVAVCAELLMVTP